MKLENISAYDAKTLSGWSQALVVTHLDKTFVVLRSQKGNFLVSNDQKGPLLWDSPVSAKKHYRARGIAEVKELKLENDHSYTAWLEVVLGDIALPNPTQAIDK